MTDLPTRIEACEATDAEVATALGYRSAPDGYGMDDWFAPDGKRLKRPPGNTFTFPPPFTTCLTTLAKECERRGIKWVMAHQVEGWHSLWIASVGSSDVDWRSGMAPTPAAALCAALVRAAQKPAR